jgi:hypothetical protein
MKFRLPLCMCDEHEGKRRTKVYLVQLDWVSF